MIWRRLGTTGVSIPEIGMGTWDYHGGPNPLRRGLEAGAQFIDTAESYGSEEVVAAAIGGMRQNVFLATKISPEHFRSEQFISSVESCLRRLQVDTIDLLQLHRPNPSVPIEETLGAAATMIDAGKVRFLGVSNFSVEQLRQAQKAFTKYPIVSNQVRYNIVDRTIEKDLLPYCEANKITVIAYSPLARGLSRIRDCDPHQNMELIAKQVNKTSSQVALNWCLRKEGVVVIPKGNSEAHILENCGASDWRLTEEQIQVLNTAIRYRRRTKFDEMLRRYTPSGLRQVGLRMLRYLPRGLRRRIN